MGHSFTQLFTILSVIAMLAFPLATRSALADGTEEESATLFPIPDYAGTLDYVLKVDVEKLGLWPGAFVKVRGETVFGESVVGPQPCAIAHGWSLAS
jgi:hypothetical protein